MLQLGTSRSAVCAERAAACMFAGRVVVYADLLRTAPSKKKARAKACDVFVGAYDCSADRHRHRHRQRVVGGIVW